MIASQVQSSVIGVNAADGSCVRTLPGGAIWKRLEGATKPVARRHCLPRHSRAGLVARASARWRRDRTRP
jgi:hypothetical protein